MATTIRVETEQPYSVIIGRSVVGDMGSLLREGTTRVGVFFAPAVQVLATRIVDQLTSQGLIVVATPLPDAEAAKTVETLSSCWDVLGQAGFTRNDAVVSVGGGATTDLVGFVAASWLRGIDVLHVPTTTLAMVDAAVGGKTGINTAVGKNLVGAFHEPRGVLVDLDVLAGLPIEEHRAGLPEIVKAGWIHDPVILDLIEADPLGALDPSSSVCEELITRAIAVKAEVVAADLRESATSGLSREILNYGHTFAHAIEKVENYSWRHGHAVSVGMIFAAELAQALGLLSLDDVNRHRAILTTLGLPISYAGSGSWDDLLATMRIDKKARGAVMRFVLLSGVAQPAAVNNPASDALEAAFLAVSSPQ